MRPGGLRLFVLGVAVLVGTASCVLTADFDALTAGDGGGGGGSQDGGGDAPSALDGATPPPGDGSTGTDASPDAKVDGGADAAVGCTAPKTIGPKSGTVATATGSGAAWVTPSSALAQDGVSSTSALDSIADASAALVVTGFDFDLPSTAIVAGVRVTIRKASASEDVRDDKVELVVGGSKRGDDKKGSGKWPTSLGDVSLGGAADRWGTTLTPAMLNDPTFGVSFRVKYDDVSGNGTAEVDAVSVTVTYCD